MWRSAPSPPKITAVAVGVGLRSKLQLPLRYPIIVEFRAIFLIAVYGDRIDTQSQKGDRPAISMEGATDFGGEYAGRIDRLRRSLPANLSSMQRIRRVIVDPNLSAPPPHDIDIHENRYGTPN